MRQYVIIGNGIAAIGAIEGIRAVDAVSPITVISAERYPAYCRPLISYYLEGKTALSRIEYRPERFYVDNGCTVLSGRQAMALDPVSKTVTLDDGTAVRYDSLCIAVGSAPFVPKFEGLETVDAKFSFMTLDDALSLEKAVSNESDVLIVGAGLIGLKCAEGLTARVKRVTVCDLADRVLPSILDADSAAIVGGHLEANGIQLLLGDSVSRFDSHKAWMRSGLSVEFDALVLAVGVRPNMALVKNAGGGVGAGIRINERMHTTLPDVYAAGDCTECLDISSGQSKVQAILPNAYMQGKCAGVNMAGADSSFSNTIPMNAIGFFGLHMMTAGSYPSQAQGGSLYIERTELTLKQLFVKDGYLVGFILIGCIEHAGIYTRLIRERVPLDTIDFDAVKKEPTLFSLGAQYREKTLGGAV